MRRLIGLLTIGAILKFGDCFPNLEAVKLPELEILAPGDVNNLRNEQQKRSIKSGSLSMNDVEATIREVQELIKANPNLPRLTRGEILDILENITKTDIERTKVMTRPRDPKAIMVVMPYTPPNPNDNRNIEEFFTKPPITQIIGSDPDAAKQNRIQNKNKSGRKPAVKNKGEENPDENKLYQAKRVEPKKVPAQIPTLKPKFQEIKTTTTTTHKPVTFETSTSSIIKETSTKFHARYSTIDNSFEKATENPISTSTRRHHHRRRPTSTTVKTDTTATTHRPHRTRRPTRRRTTPPSSVVTPTTTVSTTSSPETKHPNHKYPEESEEIFESYNRHYLPNSGLTVIKPPNLVLPADINSGFYDLAMEENNHGQAYFGKSSTLNFEGVSTSTERISKPPSEVPTKEALAEEINLPEHLHGVVKDMKLDPSLIDVPEDFHKKYEVTTHSPSGEDRKKIQALLESIGAVPTTLPPPTTLIPDVSNVADTLSPEMRDLLMSFGLIPNPKEELKRATEKTIPFVPEKAEVDPASFVGFKPLPDDGESRDEMESLLASFGLGRSYRREKSLRRNKDEDRHNELNFDVVPEQYKHVIEDIGFREKGRRIDVSPSENAVLRAHYKRENSKKDEAADSEDIKKLEKLMSTIKYLDSLNRTLTDQDIKTVDASALRELVESLNTENKVVPLDEQLAPNPINYDNGIKKNEVKRQELKLEGNITVVTPSVSSTSEESKTPSIEDLEGSFGGQTSTSTTEEPTTTTTKRTGFYYLVDWNTFLDIDDQKGKRVNLRFQPTIGNPRNFLAVNVP